MYVTWARERRGDLPNIARHITIQIENHALADLVSADEKQLVSALRGFYDAALVFLSALDPLQISAKDTNLIRVGQESTDDWTAGRGRTFPRMVIIPPGGV
jgi:hypothetical protein